MQAICEVDAEYFLADFDLHELNLNIPMKSLKHYSYNYPALQKCSFRVGSRCEHLDGLLCSQRCFGLCWPEAGGWGVFRTKYWEGCTVPPDSVTNLLWLSKTLLLAGSGLSIPLTAEIYTFYNCPVWRWMYTKPSFTNTEHPWLPWSAPNLKAQKTAWWLSPYPWDINGTASPLPNDGYRLLSSYYVRYLWPVILSLTKSHAQ